LRTYQDPQGRFQFTYPAAFGTPAAGTDNGFRNRTAAIRFSEFSAGEHAGRIILGGEAVLTSGAPQLDLQTVGGLYDAITLQIFPEPIVHVIRNALPVSKPDTFARLSDASGISSQRISDPAGATAISMGLAILRSLSSAIFGTRKLDLLPSVESLLSKS
jgi:hypothetical protein